MIVLNREARDHAYDLIDAGQVNDGPWKSSDAVRGAKRSRWHLGEDAAVSPDAADRYAYPFGRDGEVYSRALEAIRLEAGIADHQEVRAAAGKLLQYITGDLGDDAGGSERFNPNHAADGKFGAGGGGGGGGGGGHWTGEPSAHDAAEAKGLVSDASAKGLDIRLSKGGPSNARESKAVAKAEAAGQHAVSVTQSPKVEATKRQDVVTHRFADYGVGMEGPHDTEIVAKTYPDVRKGKEGRWVSQTKDTQTDPEKKSFKTRGQALRNSKEFMRGQQEAYTERSVKVTKSVAKSVKSTLDEYDLNNASKAKAWKVRVKVVTKGKGSQSAESKSRPAVLERRVVGHAHAELRVAESDGKPVIRGYAAVYNSLSDDLGGFRERIAPGAFDRALAGVDCRALVNHDPNLILGRTKAGTCRLVSDDTGLRMEIDPPDTEMARSYLEAVRRGDISQCSFAFTTEVDEWDHSVSPALRTLHRVGDLYDVSIVTYPAYPDTSAALRSLKRTRKSLAATPQSGPRGLGLLKLRLDLSTR